MTAGRDQEVPQLTCKPLRPRFIICAIAKNAGYWVRVWRCGVQLLAIDCLPEVFRYEEWMMVEDPEGQRDYYCSQISRVIL